MVPPVIDQEKLIPDCGDEMDAVMPVVPEFTYEYDVLIVGVTGAGTSDTE